MFINWRRAEPGLFTLFCSAAASFIHSLELCPLSFWKGKKMKYIYTPRLKVQADVSSDCLQSPLNALVLVSELPSACVRRYNLTLFRGRRRFICRVSEQPVQKKPHKIKSLFPPEQTVAQNKLTVPLIFFLFFVPSEREKTPNVFGLIRHNSSLKPLLYP